MRVRGLRGLFPLAAALFAAAALMAPGAGAATVVNGDFETGDLSGWNVRNETFVGSWFAYQGTKPPIGTKRSESDSPVSPAGLLQEPPQGRYAAISDQANPESSILWQDVALGADRTHRLVLLAYYNSYDPISLLSPDSLSVAEVPEGQHNQQFRIDVIRPEAPLGSLAPEDILATLFTTTAKSPQTMVPTRFSANLTPFAGQTVRLRIAVAAEDEVFNAGVDAVSIASSDAGPVTPAELKAANAFSLGKVTKNIKKGTATVAVKVPGPGLLTAIDSSAAAKRKKKPLKLIAKATKRAGGAGTVKLLIKPTAAGRKLLRDKHRLKVKLGVSFRADVGGSKTATKTLSLQLKPPKTRR